MITDFFDWLHAGGRESIYLVFLFSALTFFIGLAVSFVVFIMPATLLRLELLMVAIMVSIFVTWYFREYRK